MLETAKSDGKLKFASDSNISDNFYSFASLLLKILKTGNSCHTNTSKLAKQKKRGEGVRDWGRVFVQLVFVLRRGNAFVVLFSNCSGYQVMSKDLL